MDLENALQRYWDAAYAEGRESRNHDTEDGRAGLALRDVMLAVDAKVAAERERWKDRAIAACNSAGDGPDNGCCPTYWEEAREACIAAIQRA